jgi:DNA-binding transcriptional LysR family regulator
MDRLEAMSVLLAVVEAGSLSAGARRLGVPLATVSRKVSALEAHLKTRLLTRSTRHLALTDAGRSYVAACKRILEDLGEAERAASGEYAAPRGDLILTAPVVFGRMHVLPIVVDFLSAYPEINIRMVLADRIVHLLDDHVDLAVRIGPLVDSSFFALRVGTIRRVLCGSPAYFARHGTPTHPRDLEAHAAITFDGLMPSQSWSFADGKRDLTVAVRTRLTVNTAEAAIDAARMGLGLTRVLSYQIADAVRAGTLVRALEDFERETWPVSLVYPAQGLLPIKLRAFLDFAAPRLKAQLVGQGE